MNVRPGGRTSRDWAVDSLLFLLAAVFTAAAYLDAVDQIPFGVAAADAALGGLACAGLWVRRRWPVGLAVVVGLASVYSESAAAVGFIALFTVAVHRPIRTAVLVAAGYAAASFLALVARPDVSPPNPLQGVLALACVLGILAWGMFIRSRRQLAVAARERELSEQELRVIQARQAERDRIAREMHDVLGHRLSLLSLQAGALELNPDASPAETARAAAAIRDSAHGALEELREVIGVLRTAQDGPDPHRPQPIPEDLPRLVAESRAAGVHVELDAIDLGTVPDALGRTVFRIVQEGLTNARKHAAQSAVSVTVRGAPEDGLTVEVRNPLPVGAATPIPGAGMGIIGLRERTELSGGRLEHGRTREGEFRLQAWLPWTT
jgi:signal transduction histidine kinase